MSMIDETKQKMKAAQEHFQSELRSIRTGRANPALLDAVMVDVYGTQMRIKELASITSPEPRQLLITPFDQNNTSAIGKAIELANLGFMPIVEGNLVRINIPPMDQNMREEMKKLCMRRKEEAKVRIRNIRREANETVRKQKSNNEIPEDEMKKLEKQVQELTDKYCKDAESIAEEKEKEIMTV